MKKAAILYEKAAIFTKKAAIFTKKAAISRPPGTESPRLVGQGGGGCARQAAGGFLS